MKHFTVRNSLLFVISITCFFANTLANTTSIIPENLAEEFFDQKIVPDHVPVLPYELCKVEYPNGIVINPGEKIYNSSFVKEQPKVTWTCNKTNNYTLMFHNLDGKDEMCEVDSWLLTNIAECNLDRSDVIFSYPKPVPRLGENRFLFLVYEQKANVKYQDIMFYDANTRYIYKPREYASSHFMGDPLAGNFFTIFNRKRVLEMGAFLGNSESSLTFEEDS